uniref:Uncharacterized protein n=2 Tax=Aeromonas sp. Ne-1 TaxID=1675689 RepID=A0A0H4JD23_9GAMM|nr:hypothetical protein [Aeromonas sp. Ne-1]
MSEINFNEKNDELLGVKVKPSTKKAINDLVEKAKQAKMIEYNGDIFDLFVKNFEQDELAKKMEYGADLKELQKITRRINDIYINLAERNETNVNELQAKHGHQLMDLEEDIRDLKESKKAVQEKLAEKDNNIKELAELLKVTQERTKELELIQSSYQERLEEQKLLIDERNNQIISKNEIISQKEEVISSMREDIAKNNKYKEKIIQLEKDLTMFNKIVEDKNVELERQKESLEFECQKRVFKREQVLNKEKLEEIKVIQVQMNNQQEKYERILDEKDKLRSANYELKATVDQERSKNEQYEATISELQEKINKLESNNNGKS